jgi:tRNA 2-thiouridine synthesizing protein A
MVRHELDAKGLRCPQPILTIITYMPNTSPGDMIEITADCETFEDDVRKWCERMGKTLLAVTHVGDETTAQIQI